MKPELPSASGFWLLSAGYRDAGNATYSLIRSEGYCGFALSPCVLLGQKCIGATIE
jgi:hypothetical protein